MTIAIIPKDCLLCDLCNTELVAECGHVVRNCVWTDWGLVCVEHGSNEPVIEGFEKGDFVGKQHMLWHPLVIATGAGAERETPPASPRFPRSAL